MSAQAQAYVAAMIQAGALDGQNVDELCYYWAETTGAPCPDPELWGAGDRSIRYTVSGFVAQALQSFGDQGGLDQVLPPVVTVPTPGGNTPVPVGTVAPTPLGGLFGSSDGGMLPLILIGVLAWVLLKD